MEDPPYADGEEITEDQVYRRIPDLRTHFDYELGAALLAAFKPRPQDNGALSAYLKGYITPEEARINPRRPADQSFGLCELDVAAIRETTNGAVRVIYKPTSGAHGHAHVQVLGCEDEAIQHQLALLAVVIRRPGCAS